MGVRPISNSDANWTSETIDPGGNFRVVIMSSKRRKAMSVSGSPIVEMSDCWAAALIFFTHVLHLTPLT